MSSCRVNAAVRKLLDYCDDPWRGAKWVDELDRFIAERTCWDSSDAKERQAPIVELVGRLPVAAHEEHFVASDHFKVGQSDSGVLIGDFDTLAYEYGSKPESFVENLLPLVEQPEAGELLFYRLTRDLNKWRDRDRHDPSDVAVMGALGYGCFTNLSDIWAILEHVPKDFLVEQNSYGMNFFVRDVRELSWRITAIWVDESFEGIDESDRGWRFLVNPICFAQGWKKGDVVVGRTRPQVTS